MTNRTHRTQSASVEVTDAPQIDETAELMKLAGNSTRPKVGPDGEHGEFFLSWSEQQHLACKLETRTRAMDLDIVVRSLRSDTSRLLDLLFRLSTCAWGCRGGGHLIEGITGKCVSSARAAFRLVDFGHYDEALSIVRNVAEVDNLFFLFVEEPSSFAQWHGASAKKRRQEFSPAKVRLRLEALGLPLPYDEGRYRFLCEAGVHANPDVRPQAHNIGQIQTLGGIYQERGYVRCISELAYSTATLGGPAPILSGLAQETTRLIIGQALALYSKCETSGLTPSLDGYHERTGAQENLAQWAASMKRQEGDQ